MKEKTEIYANNIIRTLFLLKLHESATIFQLTETMNILIKRINKNETAEQAEKQKQIIDDIAKRCVIFLVTMVDDSKNTTLIINLVNFVFSFSITEEDALMQQIFSEIAIIHLSRNIPIKEFKNIDEQVIKILDVMLEIEDEVLQEIEDELNLENNQLNLENDNEDEDENYFPNPDEISRIVVNTIIHYGIDFSTNKEKGSSFLFSGQN